MQWDFNLTVFYCKLNSSSLKNFVGQYFIEILYRKNFIYIFYISEMIKFVIIFLKKQKNSLIEKFQEILLK